MKTFYISKAIHYEEIESSSPYYNKFYLIKNLCHEPIVAIPDGCVDIQFVWKNDDVEIHLCGSFLKGGLTPTGHYDKCFGIKLNNGVSPIFTSININQSESKKNDEESFNMMQVVEKRYIVEKNSQVKLFFDRIQGEKNLEDYMNIFLKYFQSLEYKVDQGITNDALLEIKSSFGTMSMTKLVKRLGYSQCYIERLFKQAVGISLKKYASIMRFQHAVYTLEKEKEKIDYETLGYYDQAHFINEFKKFTLCTPWHYVSHIEDRVIV